MTSPSDYQIPEAFARHVFEQAIREQRCGELFDCLLNDGSATVDPETGRLVLATAAQLEAMVNLPPETARGLHKGDEQ